MRIGSGKVGPCEYNRREQRSAHQPYRRSRPIHDFLGRRYTAPMDAPAKTAVSAAHDPNRELKKQHAELLHRLRLCVEQDGTLMEQTSRALRESHAVLRRWESPPRFR